jgi:hypothetical protein
MLIDVNVSLAKSLLKSNLTVPVNGTRGPKTLLKLPDRLNVSTTPALAAGAAIMASAAKTAADVNLFVHKDNNVCPPAKSAS